MQEITDGTYRVQPYDIDTNGHFFGAFEHNETEVSANWIVRLCQAKGSWSPFTAEELNRFYTPADGFTFNQLIRRGYIIDRNGVYSVTREFVDTCYKSRPRHP